MAHPSREALGISSSLYGALAACLSEEPSRKTITRLRASLAALLERRDAWDEPEVWDGVRDVIGSVKGLSLKELASDYAGLFLGGSDRSVCPSESCYLDHGLYGPATLAVIGAYAAKGFIKDPAFGEPDDHIAVECLFRCITGMDLIAKIGNNGEDMSSWLADARGCLDFVAGHLLKWAPLLAGRVGATSDTPFYRAVTALARELVRADSRLLAGLAQGRRD